MHGPKLVGGVLSNAGESSSGSIKLGRPFHTCTSMHIWWPFSTKFLSIIFGSGIYHRDTEGTEGVLGGGGLIGGGRRMVVISVQAGM